MPYIRDIKDHPTEDRRRKLDPHITRIIDRLLALELTGTMQQCFFDCAYVSFYAWTARFNALQGGKIRYYNFNDQGGVVISAVWEMMRRMKVTVALQGNWKQFDQKEGGCKRVRREALEVLLYKLMQNFDEDRGEAVGEFNYSLSEIALALINSKKLEEKEAIRILYAAGFKFYGEPTAAYEEESIINPEKGDTAGYAIYTSPRPKKS
jgi:hypothetical protein